MRTTKLIFLALLFVLFVPSSLFADVAGTRAAFGVDKAPALEALIGHIYPGSTVEWEPRLAVMAADGTRKDLRVNDAVQRNDADGFTFVMPLEFPADEPQIIAALAAFEPPPSVSRPEIVAFKTTPAYAITAVRRGSLSENAQLAEVVAMEIAELTFESPWPEVYVTYRAAYGTSNWHGELVWEAKLTTEAVAVVHRLPSSVMKLVKDNPVVAEEPLVVVNDDRQSFTIFSPAGRKSVTRCDVPCVPDGKVLLALW